MHAVEGGAAVTRGRTGCSAGPAAGRADEDLRVFRFADDGRTSDFPE